METATPMLRQYLEIKKLYPGTILFFRLGDFYEMFNEDAVTGARELGGECRDGIGAHRGRRRVVEISRHEE